MTKSLYPSLGKFDPTSPPIIEVRPSAEELKAAYARIDELENMLGACRDWFEERSDVTDGDYGAKANPAMVMLQAIEGILS